MIFGVKFMPDTVKLLLLAFEGLVKLPVTWFSFPPPAAFVLPIMLSHPHTMIAGIVKSASGSSFAYRYTTPEAVVQIGA